ncbi:GspE/PulE family protein [Megamonas funiformis]|jgi:type II secretory ATPase GspE/PulE/Tfp pilus assembly ATPase PilB-like protein|uniref:GspE/PulE family protein n=1 Tax=Megamonas funiformis TaxID=437897 RepID=UPI0022E23303|nr:GspE/PulE family protein [Megamonas funiformis]
MEIEKDLEQLSLKIMRNLQLQGKHNILQGYRNKSPVADFIDCLLENAYKLQASDIHLEPQEKYLQIRYRIDGKLILIYKASNKISNFLISYLKLISNLDIAEKRLPQDGKFIFSAQNIDIRISTIPVLFGEKVVLRLLGNKENLLNLNQMGFSKMNLKYFKDMISASSGLIVITGPVNSGKSTLLYASLNYLNRLDTNIITIEDPVELNLDGINQMQVNQKAGMDFSVALRASLRQDPDIVMIGEIRDEVVAKQAITTALTGHLVLTTLHTKNALGVPARLIDLGVSPVMLSIALLGMTSQRLVRKICPKCKTSYKPNENSLEAFFLEKNFYLGMDLYKGKGCKYCNYTGFLGQIALQEILRPTEKMRYLISRDDVDVNLKREARLTDFKSLLDDGKMKVLQGITTVQEVWKTLNGVYQIDEVPRNFTKSDSV